MTIYAINVILLIYVHVNFTKGGDWVMENQINSVQVAVENFTKKKRRCNSAAWLQIFGAIGAVGGDIAIKVASGLLSKVSGICVAIGGIGMSIFGFFKDKRSCLKCCCGTSYMDDTIYENEQREKKFGRRNQAFGNFVDRISTKLDENPNKKISETNLRALDNIENNLQINYSEAGKSVLGKIKNLRAKLVNRTNARTSMDEMNEEEQSLV